MINNVVITGRLTKDPELRFTQNGVATASFTLAVNRPFSNNSGEKETDFINIVVWRKQAENAANYLKKGNLCGVVGRIQTRNYDGNDGRKVYVTEVVAENVQFLESKKQQEQGQPQQAAYQPSNYGSDPFGTTVLEEDLPF